LRNDQLVGFLASPAVSVAIDLALFDQRLDDLLDELAHVRLRESSVGALRLDHDSGRHDDRAVALALAAHAIVERAGVRPAHSLDDFALASVVAKRCAGFLLGLSNLEGNASAFVEQAQ
jgi:hypothetical protein